MADYQLIQERTISGTGVLRTPSDITKRRHVVLYASVLRPPRSPYLNYNYNPPRSRYGFLTFLRNGYVVDTTAMEFKRQSYDTITDITSQNLIAIKCMYDGILTTFTNFAIGLQLIPISVVDLIKDYEYLDLAWDEVRFVCYADTAVILRLYSIAHDSCKNSADSPKKPPVPPEPPSELPPGTPIDYVDPPYADGDDQTSFYPGDSDIPPSLTPPGEACVGYRMIVRVFSVEAFGEPTPGYRDFTVEGWGEFSEPYYDEGFGTVSVNFRGSTGANCLGEQVPELIVNLAGYSDVFLTLLSFEEI